MTTPTIPSGPTVSDQEAGVAPAAASGTSLALPSEPGARRNMKSLLADLRPAVVTGGEPVAPLLVITALAFAAELGLVSQNVLAPEIKDFFGLTLGGITGLVGVAGFVGILFAAPIGFLADRVSRVGMVAIGAVLLAVTGVAGGFAPTLFIFGLAQAGGSLGGVFESPQNSLLADYYPPDRRAGVFAFRTMGANLARLVGPVIIGLIAAAAVWQVAYVTVGILAFVPFVVIITVLRDPVRGSWERRLMGADQDVAAHEDRPAGLGESIRVVLAVRTLRRTLWALPFIVGAALGFGTLFSLYQEQVFHVGVTERGLIGSLGEPFAIAGLLLGGAVTNRLLRYRPGRVITYAGLAAVVIGLLIAGMAVAPWFALVVAFGFGIAMVSAILAPALLALVTLVTPARVRTFSLGVAVLCAAPGLVLVATAGAVGDHLGIRAGMVTMALVFLIGAVILSTAGAGVEADIRAANAAALAAEVVRQARDAGRAKLLVCKDVDVSYDQLQVLFNVDFEVEEGEMVALLGTNGAGKSTLLRAIAGTTPCSNGAIVFDGDDITNLPAHERAGRGVTAVPGGRGVFPTLTVAENLRLAAWLFRRDDDDYEASATARVFTYFPVLRSRLNEPASNLSGGEQQMLTLAQAFLSRPRLLMIDELSLGLAPAIVGQLLEILRAIHEQGTTVVLVEQSVNVALSVADRAVFMEKGEVRFSGPTADLLARPDILRSVYLKGASASPMPVMRAARREQNDAPVTALEVNGVTKAFGGVRALDDVTFSVAEGQILGFIGPNGAGKTTLFDAISGFISTDHGTVTLYGDDITGLGADERAKLGLQRSFQDARLFPSLTVRENLAVALDRHLDSKNAAATALRLPKVKRAERSASRRAERLVEMLGIGDLADKFVRELSTGQRRLVDMACMLGSEPKVLLLDEPSSGVAQRETEELGPLLLRIKAETGCSMLVIEHDMPLIMAISEELIALDLGTVLTRGRPEEVVENPDVVRSYLGTDEASIHRSGTS